MRKKFRFDIRKKRKRNQRTMAIIIVILVLLSQFALCVNVFAADEISEQPAASTEPTPGPQDTASAEPAVSVQPTESADPNQSAEPAGSVEPTESVQPTESPEPTISAEPTESPEPTESVEPAERGGPVPCTEPPASPQPTESAFSFKMIDMTLLSVGAPDAQAGDEASLNTALTNAAGTAESPYVIEITASFYINSVKTIASGKYVKLVSSDGSTYAITRGTPSPNLFDVQGSLILENIIIDGGLSATAKNTVRVSSGATFDMEAGSVLQNAICTSTSGGSAVYNQGTFSLNGGAIKNNEVRLASSVTGGAIYNSGTFTMTAGSITGNDVSGAGGDSSATGGVLYNSSSATFTMSGGVIGGDGADANTAACSNWGGISGGVVYNAGTFIMNQNALIKGNSLSRVSSWPYASICGGAVYNSGTFTMSDSAEISGMTGNIDYSYTYGLGVYSYGASAHFTMQDTAKVKGNTGTNIEGNSNSKGGGVFNCHGSQFIMQGNAEISGNQISSTSSSSSGAGVCNEETGSLFTMKDSAKISNNTVSASGACYGGGVYNYNAGQFVLEGGIISGNTVTSSGSGSIGGGVYSYNNTTFTMSGGTITGNSTNSTAAATYSRGGGVFTSNATFTMSGGTISSNQANNTSASGYAEGGGVFNWNIFNMTGGRITGNSAKVGGGVCNFTTFNLSGSAEIDSNTATTEGGGVENTSGTFSMTGGSIADNTAPKGKGVLNAAIFNMSGSAALNTNNEVYLNSGKVISVTADLTGTSPFAVIKPSSYTAGSNVVTLVSGLSAGAYSSKFTVAPNGSTWGLKANGQNLQMAPGAIYLDGQNGLDTNDGSTKATAVATFEKAKSLLGSPGTIHICGSVTVPSGNDAAYTWSLPDGQTLKRYDDPVSSANDFTGVMVQLDGNLTLEDIAIDGGWDESTGTGVEAAKPIILESSAGNLTINAGAALQNNNIVIPNSNSRFVGSGVQGSGSVTMTGGEVSGNQINILAGSSNWADGAGIGMDAGSLTMTGGKISSNILNSTASFGAGIYTANTVFAMSGGTVKGNHSSMYGGGIFIDSGSTFTMDGGTIGGSTAGNANTATSGGGLFNFATTNMTGGSILGNTAQTGYAQGGGVTNQGDFSMSGTASITGNTASTGAGVYDYSGTFNLSGGAVVAQNNPVYLGTNRYITITGALSNTPAAWVIPASYPNYGGKVKVAEANYAGASGAAVIDSLAVVNSAYRLRAGGNDVNLVMRDAQTPVFTLNLPGEYAFYNQVSSCNLKVAAGVSDNGAITYQWYKNIVNSTAGGTPIAGATGDSYTVPADTRGTIYFYAVATNTLDAYRSASAASNIVKVTVTPEDESGPGSSPSPTPTHSPSASATQNPGPSATQNPGPSAAQNPGPSATQNSSPSASQSSSPTAGGSGPVAQAAQMQPQVQDKRGNIQITVLPATAGTPAVTLPDSDALRDLVLSQEDKDALENGENISILLKVVRVEAPVNQGDGKKIADNMGGNSLGMYLNVELLKQIGEKQQNITNTSKPIRILLAVPPELQKEGRDYSIIRVHGDETTILHDLDNDPATVTIETDRFSTYALVYKDRPEFILWLILILCILAAASIMIAVYLKQKKEEAGKN